MYSIWRCRHVHREEQRNIDQWYRRKHGLRVKITAGYSLTLVEEHLRSEEVSISNFLALATDIDCITSVNDCDLSVIVRWVTSIFTEVEDILISIHGNLASAHLNIKNTCGVNKVRERLFWVPCQHIRLLLWDFLL